MRHPFDLSVTELKTLDLDFEEDLMLDATEEVAGGLTLTTLALGEEGGSGDYFPCPPKLPPCPRPTPLPPIKPPEVTTLALGEEGGVTSLALGEEGGCPNPLL